MLALTPWLWQVAIDPIQDGGKAVRGAVPWLALLPFGVLLFIYVGTEVGFGVWIATQITLVAEASESTGAIATSLFWLGVAAGRLIASRAARGLSPEMLLIATLSVLAGGAMLLLAVPGSSGVTLVSALVVGLGCGPVFPTVLAAVSDNFPAHFRVASGALVSFGNFGAVVVPWLQGKVGDGMSGGMSVTLTLGLVMLLIALSIRARQQPQTAA
jgi:FHS family glucose/mannose:H+ symporter-like MFS transporter